MSRVVSPPKTEFDKLRQPLEPGERIVFDFFDKYLDPEWEIYIQPHMNGLRPDFVLLNPQVGMAVFEVKDWDLDAVHYYFQYTNGKPPKLLGARAGKTFSRQKDNPIEKVHRYKSELFSLYCPRLQQGNGFAAITAGVIFPFADDDRVKELFSASLHFRGMDRFPKYNPISGRNALMAQDMGAIFPEGLRRFSKYMTPELADDLRYWLVEPDSAATQREAVELDSNQRALVTSRTKSGYRRIKGAAGSGKSLVLASRAAELVNEGKKVLVITFNITLLHYLMDVAVRWPRPDGKQGRTRAEVVWLNFHSWCRRVCDEAGCSDEYESLWQYQEKGEDVLGQKLPSLVASIIDSDSDEDITRYDAILVDEGQDLLPNWWDALRKVCRPGGEMLLVADATQDIYETAKSWTDEAMTGAGFRGDWVNLPVSYRMPSEAIELASKFVSDYLLDESASMPVGDQMTIGLEPTYLRWVQISSVDSITKCRDEILRFFVEENVRDLAISDVTFLCANKAFGLDVVTALGQKGIKVVHTYALDDKESRRQKMGFYMGDSRVKATTLHSFKGWESRLIVIYIDHAVSKKDLALIYVGLTRLKRAVKGSCLTVVCSSPQLEEFGKRWPDYERQAS